MGIKVGFVNLLENATVTVTSEASGYPAYRLYDRIFGRTWKATSAATQVLRADQGADGDLEINGLVIPAGHNLSGCTLQWTHSEDNATWVAVGHWIQNDNLQIVKACAGIVRRYWRLEILNAVSPPQVGELYLTYLHTLSAQPRVPIHYGKKRFVTRNESPSGDPHFMGLGRSRRVREYYIPAMEEDDLAVWQAVDDAWDGRNPIFIEDHNGEGFFAEIEASDTPFTRENKDLSSLLITFREVL